MKESVTLFPDMALPVNEGTYQAALDVFSLPGFQVILPAVWSS